MARHVLCEGGSRGTLEDKAECLCAFWVASHEGHQWTLHGRVQEFKAHGGEVKQGRPEAWKLVSSAYMCGKCVVVTKFTLKQEGGCGEEEPGRMPHLCPDTASGTLEPGEWGTGSGQAKWVSLSDGGGSLSDGGRKMGPTVVGGSTEV